MWNEGKLVNFLYEVNSLLNFYESVSVSLDRFRDEFAPESGASSLSFRAMCRRKLRQLIKELNLDLVVFVRDSKIIFKKQEVI